MEDLIKPMLDRDICIGISNVFALVEMNLLDLTYSIVSLRTNIACMPGHSFVHVLLIAGTVMDKK
jgi:hypothetical protein